MNKTDRERKRVFFFSMNSKGQAALMDSVFFLAIVSTICTSLFFFAINYGTQMEAQLNSFYASDFSADALKVITYVNVSRTGDSVFFVPPSGVPQYDYLLTMIKEDYSDKKVISLETRKAIASTLHSVLLPFSESRDFTFFLLNENQSNFLFLLLAVHECQGDAAKCNSKNFVGQGSEIDVKRKYYYCEPLNKNVLEKFVNSSVGVNSTTAQVTLFDSSARDSAGKRFVMGLNVWITKNISYQDVSVLNNLGDKTKSPGSDFNCTCISLPNAECG